MSNPIEYRAFTVNYDELVYEISSPARLESIYTTRI
jgi:hypothetical protein